MASKFVYLKDVQRTDARMSKDIRIMHRCTEVQILRSYFNVFNGCINAS